MTKWAANGDHTGQSADFDSPSFDRETYLREKLRQMGVSAGYGLPLMAAMGWAPVIGYAGGGIGGALSAPEGSVLPGATAGSRVGLTAGLGVGIGGPLGMTLGSKISPEVAIAGGLVGAGLGGYGGYRLGKYLHWPTNAFEAQREKQERERRM